MHCNGRAFSFACLALLAVSCGDTEEQALGPSPCVGGKYCTGSLVCIDGFCVEPIGETLGDPDTSTSGDGDGDDSGDGDGDATTGDGDGDPQPVCGDGIVQAGEDCDGPDPGMTCVDLGLVGVELACGVDCQFDISGCETCGNGSIEGEEQCDGAALGGKNCTHIGYSQGTLLCDDDCTFSSAECCWNEGFGCFGNAPPEFGDCCPGLSCGQFGCY